MTTQADISAEIALLAQEYASAGVVEADVRLDYPPYRSSLLRHPTKSPVQVDPEGVELWRAGLRRSATSGRSRPT